MKDDNEADENAKTPEPESADKAVDQKNVHSDNDNEFSPGFKPTPDAPKLAMTRMPTSIPMAARPATNKKTTSMDAAFCLMSGLFVRMGGLELFRHIQVFFQPRQHFLRKALELHCAFGFVVGHGVGLFLEQLDGVLREP